MKPTITEDKFALDALPKANNDIHALPHSIDQNDSLTIRFRGLCLCVMRKVITVDSGYSELPRDRQNWFTITEVHYNRSNLHSMGL